MKQVLIIDSPPLFREFLKEKFSAEKVLIEAAQGRRDAFTKLISILPSLVIIDISTSFKDILEFLEKKKSDPNASSIPVVIAGPIIERDQAASLAQYNVVKYFNKPIKFDIFFESIGRILRIGFSIDVTPCILEIHLTNNIIFIEIAQGLNREKIALLKYKIAEVIDQNKLSNPKIILMMTDLSLSFVDGANLEMLLDNVTADARIQKRNVKVLSMDSFTRDLIEGHVQYEGIEVVTNLSTVLNTLIENPETNDIADLISEKILTPTGDVTQGSVQMRFHSETGLPDDEHAISLSKQIAVVDDDIVTRSLLQKIFSTISAKVDLFDSGAEFLLTTNKKKYDLVILDIFMPGLSGFDILTNLHNKKYDSPVIIYSSGTTRETVVQALSLGAKSYLIKPLRPEAILQKSLEILNSRM